MDEFVRLRPNVFAELWHFCGAFDIDLMTSPASAHCIPAITQGASNRLLLSSVSRDTHVTVPRE